MAQNQPVREDPLGKFFGVASQSGVVQTTDSIPTPSPTSKAKGTAEYLAEIAQHSKETAEQAKYTGQQAALTYGLVKKIWTLIVLCICLWIITSIFGNAFLTAIKGQ